MQKPDVVLPIRVTLDYSFKDLRTISDIVRENPRTAGPPPSNPLAALASPRKGSSSPRGGDQEQNSDDAPDSPDQLSPSRKMRFAKQTVGLRLNNNQIDTLADIALQLTTIQKPIPNPVQHLMWLDLSFNQISRVDKSILELENLKTLLLHGNKLSNLAEMEKLAGMKSLKNLTANGNPFEEKKFYRVFMIGVVSAMKHLDHVTVTKDEKAVGARFYKSYCSGRIAWRERKKELAEEAAKF